MQIAVLGAGMVGRAMAIDLSSRFDVTSIDLSEVVLKKLSGDFPKIKTIKQDLADYKSYRFRK